MSVERFIDSLINGDPSAPEKEFRGISWLVDKVERDDHPDIDWEIIDALKASASFEDDRDDT